MKKGTFILGIDPGTEKSGVVICRTDGASRLVKLYDQMKTVQNNHSILKLIGIMARQGDLDVVAIEGMSHQGSRKGIGETTFRAAEWIGRFVECTLSQKPTETLAGNLPAQVYVIPRREIHKRVGPKDTTVRENMIQLMGPPGTVARMGPTYGVTSHGWQALAVVWVCWRFLKTGLFKSHPEYERRFTDGKVNTV